MNRHCEFSSVPVMLLRSLCDGRLSEVPFGLDVFKCYSCGISVARRGGWEDGRANGWALGRRLGGSNWDVGGRKGSSWPIKEEQSHKTMTTASYLFFSFRTLLPFTSVLFERGTVDSTWHRAPVLTDPPRWSSAASRRPPARPRRPRRVRPGGATGEEIERSRTAWDDRLEE